MRTSKSCRRHRMPGFTLIELMITVAIVGILAAIALPMYFDQVMRSKIIDGTTKISDFRSKMERYFQDNRTYQNGANCGVNPIVSTADYFTITCTALTATSYVISATGVAANGMNGFVYRVDQTGAKFTTGVPPGWSIGTGTCWVLRKDGSC